MNELIQHTVTVFLGFFAIMNPFANTTIFVGLTSNMVSKEQSRVAFKSLLVSFFIILAFSVFGKMIFHLFGISLPALRIAGGILVFIIGLQMLRGETSKMHSSDKHKDSDPSISPLAVPILAGPGSIATAMNFSASGGWEEISITILAFCILCIITYLCFIAGQRLVNLIGHKMLDIITRLMGLILAVVAIQMIIHGVTGVIQSLN